MASPELPRLGKSTKVTGALRTHIGVTLLGRYNNGASIRDLAAETGRSSRWVATVLREAGVVMRPPGNPGRRR